MLEYVSDEIDENQIAIVKDKKKTSVTITGKLDARTIRTAMSKINFTECKEKFFGRPLYCRPLRDITPEKTSSTSALQTGAIELKTPVKTSSTSALEPGDIQTIPGLSSEEQARAESKKKKKERQKQKKQQEIERKEKEERQLKNISAFDLMMKTRQLPNKPRADPRDSLLPTNCLTPPCLSSWGQELNRRLSFGSTSNLKRGPAELDSPNSPELFNEFKKNKKTESVADQNTKENS